MAKREKLDAACWVMQDFNTQVWTKYKVFPKSMRHAASLTARTAPTEDDGKVYETHRKRLLEAWETMKATDQKEWLSACKAHEDEITKDVGVGIDSAKRNTVCNHAA